MLDFFCYDVIVPGWFYDKKRLFYRINSQEKKETFWYDKYEV